MRVVNFSDARNRLKSVLDQVVNDSDCTVISRRDAKDALVMSLDCFKGLIPGGNICMSIIRLFFTLLLLSILLGCHENNKPDKGKVLKVLEKPYANYSITVNVYYAGFGKEKNYYHIKGIMKVDCHTCVDSKKYFLGYVDLCHDNLVFRLPMLNNTIASVVPSVEYRMGKRLYEFDVMWSSPLIPPYVVNVKNLTIC